MSWESTCSINFYKNFETFLVKTKLAWLIKLKNNFVFSHPILRELNSLHWNEWRRRIWHRSRRVEQQCVRLQIMAQRDLSIWNEFFMIYRLNSIFVPYHTQAGNSAYILQFSTREPRSVSSYKSGKKEKFQINKCCSWEFYCGGKERLLLHT